MRQLPHSLEAEQALLGAMLIYPNTIKTAIETGLIPDDFFLEAHKKVFTAITELSEMGKPVDGTSLITRLSERGQLPSIGGADYILQLADHSVSSANVKYYVEMIQDRAYMRNLILTAQRIAEDGFVHSGDLDDVMDQAEKSILNVTRNRRTSDFRNAKEVVSTVMETITKMSSNKSNITGLKTSFRALDNLTNGLQRGDLIILAARPSMGKTAFALNLAMQVSRHNQQPVALFSLEMPAEQLITRMLSAASMIPSSQLRTGYLSGSEWNMLNEAATEMKAMQLFVDDTPSIRVSEVFSKCRKLRAEHGLGLVVIDYIQLIMGSGRNNENRQQEVSEISRSLKALAREMQVPVIALSQLSRLVERREDKRPMLSDLRESGALEQDADIVMFLYRDEYYQKEKSDDKQVKAEIDIAKHRNGPTGKFELAFDLKINAFYNIAKDDAGQ